MKIKFNNGESFLFPDSVEPSEKLVLVNEFLGKKLVFDGKHMTVEDYFSATWDKRGTIIMMDKIATYLSKMPDQNKKEDKYVLSRNKISEMEKGYYLTTEKDSNDKLNKVVKQARYTSFSGLDDGAKENLGLSENKDED